VIKTMAISRRLVKVTKASSIWGTVVSMGVCHESDFWTQRGLRFTIIDNQEVGLLIGRDLSYTGEEQSSDRVLMNNGHEIHC
jgi:hypothetical protein